MRSGPFAWALVLVASTVSSIAHAEDVMLLPVAGTPEIVAARGTEALAVVERQLTESGLTVLSGAPLRARAASAHVEACEEPTCAGAFLTATHMTLAVGIALWSRGGMVQAAVVLVDADGHQVSASADGADSALGQAVTAALAQARARWEMRGGTTVRAVGAPAGASITVDREPWGVIPHEGVLASGAHRFSVSADGHETERRDVDVPASTEPLELRFDLALASASTPSIGGSGPDVGLIASGSVVALAGVAAIVVAIVGAASPEVCVSSCGDATAAFQRPALGPILAWGIGGGVALITGAVLIGIGASSGASAPSSTVRLGPGSLSVTF